MTAWRSFLGVLSLALLAAPLAGEAQPARVYHVGVILQGDPYYPAIDGLRDGLRGLGFEEGKQFVLSVRDAKGDLKAVETAARSLEGGTRLVLLAKTLHPDGLELHTHQENHVARQLYEKHGFRAVKFGLSPPPESAPDVEYHWRPADLG